LGTDRKPPSPDSRRAPRRDAKEAGIIQLITLFACAVTLIADLDPLGAEAQLPRGTGPETYGLNHLGLDRDSSLAVSGEAIGEGASQGHRHLREILETLRADLLAAKSAPST